jgi:DeoR family transcriptional regulator of aga operon
MVEQELVRASDRRARIAQMLREGRRVRVADLVREFGVTDTSIRRDLAILEANGVLLRVHGGAVARASESRPRGMTDRMRLHLAEKQRIGEAAARLIEPGEIILLDSGTTTLQVATHVPLALRTTSMLTIITNSLRLAEEVLNWPAPNVILLGGLCLPDYQAIVGAQALEQLEHVMVDKVFLGIDGLTMSEGATTADILMAEINRRMSERARQVILVTDSSKLGRAGFEPIVQVNQIHRLVTDTGAPQALIEELRAEGVQVDTV